jgi:hypothetical protein
MRKYGFQGDQMGLWKSDQKSVAQQIFSSNQYITFYRGKNRPNIWAPLVIKKTAQR